MLSNHFDPTAEREARIAQARHAVMAGASGDVAVRHAVAPWITRSWKRCLDSGRQPDEHLAFDMVDATALRRLADHHRPLLQAAQPVLAQLCQAIAGMRYFALLTDAHGTVVEVAGAVDHHNPHASAIGRVGIDLSEAAVGTTAIGAALTELQPVWLHRGEHFFAGNRHYSCAGAPLLDPQGQCIGMLDVTGVDVPERPELLHLVARSARALEDALLVDMPHALLLRLNWPGTLLGGPSDGLLALDEAGYVRGSNSAARQLLPQPLHAPGSPLHCGDLIALHWAHLFDAARQRGAAPVLELPLWSGLRLHATAQWAHVARSAHATTRTLQPPRAAPAGVTIHEAHPVPPEDNTPPRLSAPRSQALAPPSARPGHAGSVGPGLSSADSTTPSVRAPPQQRGTAPLLRETQAALIRQAVQDARGNVAEAARALGISRATVYRKLGAPRTPS